MMLSKNNLISTAKFLPPDSVLVKGLKIPSAKSFINLRKPFSLNCSRLDFLLCSTSLSVFNPFLPYKNGKFSSIDLSASSFITLNFSLLLFCLESNFCLESLASFFILLNISLSSSIDLLSKLS